MSKILIIMFVILLFVITMFFNMLNEFDTVKTEYGYAMEMLNFCLSDKNGAKEVVSVIESNLTI